LHPFIFDKNGEEICRSIGLLRIWTWPYRERQAPSAVLLVCTRHDIHASLTNHIPTDHIPAVCGKIWLQTIGAIILLLATSFDRNKLFSLMVESNHEGSYLTRVSFAILSFSPFHHFSFIYSSSLFFHPSLCCLFPITTLIHTPLDMGVLGLWPFVKEGYITMLQTF
jgi:hypothetical protein